MLKMLVFGAWELVSGSEKAKNLIVPTNEKVQHSACHQNRWHQHELWCCWENGMTKRWAEQQD